MAFDPDAIPTRGTVLLAEDDPITSALSARALSQAGYEVTVAEDGLSAFELLRERPFDVVITDADMPKMNGFELVREMRKDRDLRRTPVLFVTGCSESSDLSRGYRMGADGYLLKPVQAQDLIEEVDSLLMRVLRTHSQLGASALSGRLDVISVVAALVFLHTQEQNGILRLSRPGADGQIVIRDGEPIDARVGRAVWYEEALATMLGWNAGTFRFEPCDVSQAERTLEGPLAALLMHADGIRRAP